MSTGVVILGGSLSESFLCTAEGSKYVQRSLPSCPNHLYSLLAFLIFSDHAGPALGVSQVGKQRKLDAFPASLMSWSGAVGKWGRFQLILAIGEFAALL